MTSAASRLRRLNGSKAIEPFDEGPRLAGIGAAKWPARDALVAGFVTTAGAGFFEPFDEGPFYARAWIP